jgi:NhaA family Na+:H+ antiporter
VTASRRRPGEATGPFHEFFQTEAAGGAVLLACALIALGLANSPWAEAFHHFWERRLPWPSVAPSCR